MKSVLSIGALSAATWLSGCATQAPQSAEFPTGASTPSATQLTQMLQSRSFSLEPSSPNVQVDFGADGSNVVAYFRGNAARGTWRTQDGAVCFEFTTIPSTCNQVRRVDAQIYLKRDSGQVVHLKPR